MTRTNRRGFLALTGTAAVAALAGCSDGGGDDPTDRGPVSIEELAFAADRPEGYDEFEERQDGVYRSNEVVWIYLALSDLSGEPLEAEEGEDATTGTNETTAGEDDSAGDDRVQIDLREELVIEDPSGDTPIDTTFSFDPVLQPSQLDGFFVANDVVLSGDAAFGTYGVEVTVRDLVSETQDSESATFEVVE